MSSIAPTSWYQKDIRTLDKDIIRRSKLHPLVNRTTGLNPRGQNAFEAQVRGIAAQFGQTEPLSWGKNGEGKFILLQQHERRAEIEEALNNDSALKEILADPKNSYDVSQGGYFATNGYDSAHFSEEAMKRYEEQEKNGGGTPVMSVDEYAKMLEWQANQQYAVVMTDEQERALHETGKTELNPGAATVDRLNSETINELLDKKGLLEKELKAVLEEAGMDTSDLKNILLLIGNDGENAVVDAFNVSKSDAARIGGILAKPENDELRGLISTYFNASKDLNDELKAATGLNERDLQEIMQSGISLSSIENDKLQSLFAEDAGLASALESYLQPDQFLTDINSISGNKKAKNTMRGLEDAIMGELEAVRMKFGEEEYKNLRENLVVTANSNGEYTITGVSNKEIYNRLEYLVKFYVTDEGHVDNLKHGEAYQKALNNTPGDAATSFTLTFAEEEESGSTVRYGANSYSEEEEAAARKDISEAVNKQINDTLKQENKNALASPLDITVNENGKLSVRLPSTDPNRKFITDMLDKLNESLLENIKKMRNGEEASDPISGMVFDLVRYGSRKLG